MDIFLDEKNSQLVVGLDPVELDTIKWVQLKNPVLILQLLSDFLAQRTATRKVIDMEDIYSKYIAATQDAKDIVDVAIARVTVDSITGKIKR